MSLTKYRLLVLSPLVLLQGCGPETGFCLIKDGGEPARSVTIGRISNLPVICYGNAGESVTEIPYDKLTSGDGLPDAKTGLPRRLNAAEDNLRIDFIDSSSSDVDVQVVGGEFQVAIPAWTTITSFKFSFYGNYAKNPLALNQTRLNTPTITVKPEDAPRHAISLVGAPTETQISHKSPHLTSQIPSGYFSGFTVGAGETIRIDVPTQGLTCSWSCDSGVYIVCGLEVSIEQDAICTYIPNSNPTLSQFSTQTTGSGKVVATPNAPALCPATGPCTLSTGTNIELLAEPDMGSSFLGWGEDCAAAGRSPTATIVLAKDMLCTAIFTQTGVPMVNLTVEVEMPMGVDARVVAESPSIACGNACTYEVASGQSVTLRVERQGDGQELEVAWTCAGQVSGETTVTVAPTEDTTCHAAVSLPQTTPCGSLAGPTIVFAAEQSQMGLVQDLTLSDEPYLVVLNQKIDMSARGSSSPGGNLEYLWEELDGSTSSSSAGLDWTPRNADTRWTLTVTDACGKVATKNLYFLAP